MPLDLYYHPNTGPSRSVLMLAKDIGVPVNLKGMRLSNNDRFKPDFLKINPLHAVPAINDDGFCLADSHAILMYLADKYDKSEKLYPKELTKRALVNQRMFFDTDFLNGRFSMLYYPIMRHGLRPDPEMLERVDEALKVLNQYLEDSQFVAGNDLTIADYSLFGTVTSMEAVEHDIARFPNVTRWLALCRQSMPSHKNTEPGAKNFGVWFRNVTNP